MSSYAPSPSPYALNTPRRPRPPLVNPYDKFTQEDFDKWIGGITSALRNALGHEPLEAHFPAVVHNNASHVPHARQDTSEDEYESGADGANDSLADIRASYVARLSSKGKARDPMEGPGLLARGKGGKDAPIEIDLDEDDSGRVGSSDEDALDDEEVIQHLSFVQDSEEEEEESSSSDEEGRPDSDNVIDLLSSDEEMPEVACGDEYIFLKDGSESVCAERDENSGNEDMGSSPRVLHHARREHFADYEEEELEEDQSVDEEEDIAGEEDNDNDGGDDSDEAGEERGEPPPLKKNGKPEIIALDSDEEEDQLDEEAEAFQPADHDTAFPPHSSDTKTHVNIRDPWIGPQTFAENYYSGGPVLPLLGVLSAHHLGANDDAGDFLTPDVITLVESNERGNLADEELNEPMSQIPRLQFVHGDTQTELLPDEILVATEAVASHDIIMESNHRSPQGSPTPDVQNEDSALERQVGAEDGVKVLQSVCEVEAVELAARQVGDDLDNVYEEMEAEVERENRAEIFLKHPNRSLSSPVHHKTLTVTIEDATDEEATDKASSEDEGLLSSPIVVPLGTSDLDVDVESIFEDQRGEFHSGNIFSPHLSEADGQGEMVVHPAELNGLDEAPQVTENSEAQSEPPDVTIQPSLESPAPAPSVDEVPVIIDLDDSLDHVTVQNTFPLTDFVNTAVEMEHEQQQLPTPPAENESFLNPSRAKHHSLESGVLFDASADEHSQALTVDDEIANIQAPSASVLDPSSILGQDTAVAVPELKATGVINSTAGSAVLEEGSEPISMYFKAESTNQILTIDDDDDGMAVYDITDDVDVVPDVWRGIIDEVASKAASEEPLVHDEEQPTGLYSKESSILSIGAGDSAIPDATSYSVEEIPEDEVTDDDADGEVDPDMSVNLPQNEPTSELKELAGEIFKDVWWTTDSLHEPAVETDMTIKESCRDDSCSVRGAVEEAAAAVSYAGEGTDEDDIASSREASPLPMPLRSTRSPSPTIDPKDLISQSLESLAPTPREGSPAFENDLYGGAKVNDQVSPHGKTAEGNIGGFAYLTEPVATPFGEEPSPTIPGLTLTTSHRRSSPIPGLGARISEDSTQEAVDGEIPGLTWSKMFSSAYTTPLGGASRSASFPQVVPSTPTQVKVSNDWITAGLPRRAATEQTLFSDPYPYSLSTPGFYSVKDDGEDTEEDLEEQDMSMSSSSSIDKDSEKEVAETGGGMADVPTEAVQQVDEPTNDGHDSMDTTKDAVKPIETDNTGDADQDRDADGDLDPDFMQFSENTGNEVVVPDGTPTPLEEPTTLIQSENPVTLVAVETHPDDKVPAGCSVESSGGQSPREEQPSDAGAQAGPVCQINAQEPRESDTVGAPETERTPEVKSESQESKNQPSTAEEPVVLPREMTPEIAIPASPDTESVSTPKNKAAILGVVQNGKRKRSFSPEPQHEAQNNYEQADDTETARRSEDVDLQSRNGVKRARTIQENGKIQRSYLSDQSSLSSDEGDSSDASSADRMLRAGSKDRSTPKSPMTVTFEPFYPMLHRHGGGAKRQRYQGQLLSQPQRAKARSSSSSSTHAPFLSQRAPSSRATRSNCRYRKISVPKEDDGPRVCFLVPGCSLGDEEVIEENEIEDLGEASYADSLRMIRDIESLDFDSYLIGVLRQLVGVDLLREQEVFYLPAPGEEPPRKSQLKKAGSDKSTQSRKGSRPGNPESPSVLNTPRHSAVSLKAPSSKAGSISTSASHPSRERGSSTPPSSIHSDLSSDERGDSEGERKVETVRRGKLEKKRTLSSLADRPSKSGKRGRRLASDALAYKPGSESEDEVSGDEKMFQSKHKTIRSGSRGVKRTRSGRTFAGGADIDERDTKKPRRDRYS